MDAVIREPRGSAVMITIELTQDEALSLRKGMRAAIFAVTLDAKNWVKAIQKILSSAAFKNQTDTRAEYVWVWSMLRYSQHQAEDA